RRFRPPRLRAASRLRSSRYRRSPQGLRARRTAEIVREELQTLPDSFTPERKCVITRPEVEGMMHARFVERFGQKLRRRVELEAIFGAAIDVDGELAVLELLCEHGRIVGAPVGQVVAEDAPHLRADGFDVAAPMLDVAVDRDQHVDAGMA